MDETISKEGQSAFEHIGRIQVRLERLEHKRGLRETLLIIACILLSFAVGILVTLISQGSRVEQYPPAPIVSGPNEPTGGTGGGIPSEPREGTPSEPTGNVGEPRTGDITNPPGGDITNPPGNNISESTGNNISNSGPNEPAESPPNEPATQSNDDPPATQSNDSPAGGSNP